MNNDIANVNFAHATRAHDWIRPNAHLRSAVLLVTGSLNFPDFLSIFRSLRTFTKFRALYLQDGLSFFNNYFAFHFILVSSFFRIMYTFCA